jgi:predicted ATPase
MRLLFIYFYKDFGTFEKGSIIHLSKKYKFTLEKENPTENEFYFNKEENPNFIEDFYSEKKNIDIGVLIGENGTGKSVLLNSIRDKKNNYSIVVYEENNSFYMIENDLFKIEKNEVCKRFDIPFNEDNHFTVEINNKKVNKFRAFKSIYYSSILEKINENLNDDFDVSNIYLLNKIDENNLEKKLELLEIDDLHKMNNFKYDIKTDISKTFFEDAKEFIKDSYILLFERTMNEIRNKKDSEKFEQIYHQLSDFIRKDIIKFYFDEEKLHISEFKNDEVLLNEYLEKYEKDFERFFIIHNIDKNKIFGKIEERMKIHKNQLFDDKFIDELLKIDFNFSKKSNEEIKIFLDEIKDLFKFKISHPLSKNTDEKRIFMYFNIKKVLETCIEIIEFKTSNIKGIKKIFNLYKIYYLSIEFGVLDEFLKKLFMENKINDLLFLNYKDNKATFKSDSIEYPKQKIINEIKQIIENNYSLFYDEVKNDLENLDDEILKLLILKKVENFPRENEDKKQNKDENENYYKLIYVYLSHLLKSESLESYEKEFLHKKLEKERDLIFELSVLHNQKCKDISLDKINFDKYNEFIKNTIPPFSFTYNPPISSGQKAKEIINARINDAIQKINKKNQNENILILLDEADLKLHLEWQRKFLYDLIEFLNSYSNNKFYVLYATHSPMILSDITNDRVVFLKKKNDKYSEDKQDFSKSTFGANIYDIYADSFFVKKFMGEFAQNKINEVIKIIDEYKEKKEKNPDEFMPNEKALDNLKIVKSIGESLLRNKLEDEIKALSELEIKDDVSIIVENLKDKNFEEIKQELNKYSQDKQRELLEKLFGNQND